MDKQIQKALLPICLDIEQNVVKHDSTDAKLWAHTNAKRHAHVVQTILDYIKRFNPSKISILNASGPSCGHQDFSIAQYLRDNGIDFEWHTYESPNSEYLEHPVFKRYIKDLGIQVHLCDFAATKPEDLYGDKKHDIILFTEIAEHLDHSTLLNSLKAVKDHLKPDGIMIFTTPNLTWFPYRLTNLLGNADAPYWGDEKEYLEKGIYGHMVLYDIKRMVRLLKNIGFNISDFQTVTYGYGISGKTLARKIIYRISEFFSIFFSDSRMTLFIIGGN